MFMRKIGIENTNTVESAIAVLRLGGIVLHPTETCYGLAVDVFNKKALEKLYTVKGMERNKPLSVLVSGLEMALKYGEFSEKALKLAKKYWPGPLSIVVPRKNLPEFFNIGDEFVSFRCSSNDFCMSMVEKFGSPVVTTSANRAGLPQLYSADGVEDAFGQFANEIDLVVNGGRIERNKPSTIVKVEGNKICVIRQGDVLISA